MTRNWKIFIAILAAGVLIGLIGLRSLHRRMARLAQTEVTDEQARREVLAPPVSTPTDVAVKASIFWGAGRMVSRQSKLNCRCQAIPCSARGSSCTR